MATPKELGCLTLLSPVCGNVSLYTESFRALLFGFFPGWEGPKFSPDPFFFIGLPGVYSRKSAVLGNTSPKANMEEEMTLPVYDFELLYFCAK